MGKITINLNKAKEIKKRTIEKINGELNILALEAIDQTSQAQIQRLKQNLIPVFDSVQNARDILSLKEPHVAVHEAKNFIKAKNKK